MTLLVSMPGGGLWMVVLLAIALVVLFPYYCYRAGFRNGQREGERLQLQKQVDKSA